MPQMIFHHGELIRISPYDAMELQWSNDGGKLWRKRYRSNQMMGAFIDLCDADQEIYCIAENGFGIYSSKDGGKLWNVRYHAKNPMIGEFKSLLYQKGVLLAETSVGVFVSNDGGRLWRKK